MDEDEAGQPAEGRDGQALAARDENVLAQLHRTACHSQDDQCLEHSLVRPAELVAVDHRDREHELDLLLECVYGLACHGAERQRGAQPWSNRYGAAQRSGGGHPASRGTDELQRKLIIGVVRMRGADLLHLGPDRRLASVHGPGQPTHHGAHLRRQPVEVHPKPKLRARS